MWHQPRTAVCLQSVGISCGLTNQHLNNQKPEHGISTGIMRQYPGNAAWKPHTFGCLSHYPPISPQIRPSWACPCCPSSLKYGLHQEPRGLCFSPTLKAVPTPFARPPAQELMGKAVSGSQAVQPQEMVENSFRRASWLSVWKARFLRTLVLMDRTSSLKKAASLCCSE